VTSLDFTLLTFWLPPKFIICFGFDSIYYLLPLSHAWDWNSRYPAGKMYGKWKVRSSHTCFSFLGRLNSKLSLIYSAYLKLTSDHHGWMNVCNWMSHHHHSEKLLFKLSYCKEHFKEYILLMTGRYEIFPARWWNKYDWATTQQANTLFCYLSVIRE